MFRTIVNIQTGDITQVALTEQELLELANRPPESRSPMSCSPWQIRKALIQLNLDEQVEQLVSSSTDKILKTGWEFANEFRSDEPFVISMGQALGKTPEEVYDLIQFASTL